MILVICSNSVSWSNNNNSNCNCNSNNNSNSNNNINSDGYSNSNSNDKNTGENLGIHGLRSVLTYENLTSDFIVFLVLTYRIYRTKQNFLIPWDEFRSIPKNWDVIRHTIFHILGRFSYVGIQPNWSQNTNSDEYWWIARYKIHP